jgi:predicted double-glycine peptidase
LDIPKNTSATGTCGNNSQVIELVWDNEDNTNNTLTIVFEKDDTDSHFMIQMINLTVTPNEEIFPSIKGKKPEFTKVL